MWAFLLVIRLDNRRQILNVGVEGISEATKIGEAAGIMQMDAHHESASWQAKEGPKPALSSLFFHPSDAAFNKHPLTNGGERKVNAT